METPSSSISIDSSTGKSSSSSLWKPKLNSVWWRLVIESCGWKEICSRPTTAEAYNEQEGTWIFTIYLEVGSVQYIYICYQKLQPAASQLTTGSVFLTPTNLFCTISASNKLSYIRQHNIGSAYYSPAIMDHIKLLESDAGGQSLIIKYDGNIWACTVNVT